MHGDMAVGKSCQRKKCQQNYDEEIESKVNGEVRHGIDTSGQTHLNKSTKRRNGRKNEGRRNEWKKTGDR